jgi:hypothetical protein
MKNEGRDELMKRKFYAQQEHKIEKFYILYFIYFIISEDYDSLYFFHLSRK